MPRHALRRSLPCLFAALLGGAAVAQEVAGGGRIAGPPSETLRRTLAAAAGDWLADLPVVKGAEISDEIVPQGRRGLRAVCVRWRSPDRTGGYAFNFVTIADGSAPETAWGHDVRCLDQKLSFHPFPEMGAGVR